MSRRPPTFEPAEGQIAHSDSETLSHRELPVNAAATNSIDFGWVH